MPDQAGGITAINAEQVIRQGRTGNTTGFAPRPVNQGTGQVRSRQSGADSTGSRSPAASGHQWGRGERLGDGN